MAAGGETAEVLLFHHALGQAAGSGAFADELRSAGHVVHTPGLYDGRTFATLAEGLAHAEVGFGELIERGARAVDGLPEALAYAGFSLGVLPAQKLAQTRPGARGALLFYSCVPTSEFGTPWPADVPCRSTGWTPTRSSSAKATSPPREPSSGRAPKAELFLHPGDQHCFADPGLPSYDPGAAARLTRRVLDFLRDR